MIQEIQFVQHRSSLLSMPGYKSYILWDSRRESMVLHPMLQPIGQ